MLSPLKVLIKIRGPEVFLRVHQRPQKPTARGCYRALSFLSKYDGRRFFWGCISALKTTDGPRVLSSLKVLIKIRGAKIFSRAHQRPQKNRRPEGVIVPLMYLLKIRGPEVFLRAHQRPQKNKPMARGCYRSLNPHKNTRTGGFFEGASTPSEKPTGRGCYRPLMYL